MNIIVVSDLHGSLSAAELISNLMARHQAQMLILLGDLLYHGPRNPMAADYNPALCAESLNALSCRILAVRGNCDAEVDLGLLHFPVASDFCWLVLGELKVFVSHGHRYGNNPPIKTGDAYLSGHTHKPESSYRAGAYFWNPGSISMPKDGFAPSYGLISGNSFSVLNLDGEAL